MSVPVGQRHVPDTPSTRLLEAAYAAQSAALHTIRLCTNPNVFLPQFQTALTDDLIRTSKDIYIWIWTANKIMVSSQSAWAEREALQRKAIFGCDAMIAMIGLAKRLFPKVRRKKAAFWARKVLDAKHLTQKWHASDVERFGGKTDEELAERTRRVTEKES